jgi:hypothetical protein
MNHRLLAREITTVFIFCSGGDRLFHLGRRAHPEGWATGYDAARPLL